VGRGLRSGAVWGCSWAGGSDARLGGWDGGVLLWPGCLPVRFSSPGLSCDFAGLFLLGQKNMDAAIFFPCTSRDVRLSGDPVAANRQESEEIRVSGMDTRQSKNGQLPKMGQRYWRIGEPADATGLTVRTLGHYDDISLLLPSRRTCAGHHLYTEQDARRLYAVLALRDLGLSLKQIKVCLDTERADFLGIMREHLAHVEQQIETCREVRARLSQVLG